MYEPRWSDNSYPDFDYQNISYYSAPKRRPQLDSIEEVDPALRQTWERLNIPVEEQKRLANVKPVRRHHGARLWQDAGAISGRASLRRTQISRSCGSDSPLLSSGGWPRQPSACQCLPGPLLSANDGGAVCMRVDRMRVHQLVEGHSLMSAMLG